MPTGVYKRKSAWDRFWDNILVSGDCWEWSGYINDSGYGILSINNKDVRAHRFIYEEIVSDIPGVLSIDHLCRNRSCVNPNHLEPVTKGENNRRGVGVGGINYRKTHCIHGHEFTDSNITWWNGWRFCRACNRRRMRDRENGK